MGRQGQVGRQTYEEGQACAEAHQQGWRGQEGQGQGWQGPQEQQEAWQAVNDPFSAFLNSILRCFLVLCHFSWCSSLVISLSKITKCHTSTIRFVLSFRTPLL